MELEISPAKSINGVLEMPGDKSISHRALIFGSLCEGRVEVKNFLEAGDCLSTLESLRKLGVAIERKGSDAVVCGVGKYGFKQPSEAIDVKNSGTTMRILPGLLAAQPYETTLVGDSSLSKRPMNRVIEPLTKMGAKIESREGGLAPLKIIGGELKGIDYTSPVASAQVKSALLLAGLYADGRTTVHEKYQSRDHTERMLKYLGADIEINGTSYTIEGNSQLAAKPIIVPGDISSAAFFIVAALLLDSDLTIKNVGVNKTRTGVLEVLKKAGANIELHEETLNNNEPVADLHIQSSKLAPITITAEDVPLLVDEIPILAVAATQIDGVSVISGAEELRVKETDRLEAISSQLKIMGANIEEKKDGLIIKGPTKLSGATLDSGGDHRMAMSLAIAALVAEGQTVIKGAESIDISLPGFKDLLQTVTS